MASDYNTFSPMASKVLKSYWNFPALQAGLT